jgi:hypothetical protein
VFTSARRRLQAQLRGSSSHDGIWGRPSFYDLWHDLRAATREIRPDWDLSTPGLREAWEADDHSHFHGWDRKASEPATST